jgi:hypothetical protein
MGPKVYPPKHILHKKLGLLLKHMVKRKNWSQCHSVAMSLTRLQYTLSIKAMALPHFASVQCSLKHIFPIWFLDTYLDQKSYQNHKTLMTILEALPNYSRSKSLCCACMNFGAEEFHILKAPIESTQHKFSFELTGRNHFMRLPSASRRKYFMIRLSNDINCSSNSSFMWQKRHSEAGEQVIWTKNHIPPHTIPEVWWIRRQVTA